MENQFQIDNRINSREIWLGIGGHFDSLAQIIDEFIDNCASNFMGNSDMILSRSIVLSLREMSHNGNVQVTIEDSGTGIKDLNVAFTLGSQAGRESPLNEHGFGLKHALASANPENDRWTIYTRTAEDFYSRQYRRISAPFSFDGFCGMVCKDEPWPGKLNGTGTIIQFECSNEMYRTLARGLKGGVTSFRKLADILCEEIGFVYSGLIQEGKVNITLEITDADGVCERMSVGSVKPDWEKAIGPGNGSEVRDLGGGMVRIEYQFGSIHPKMQRVPFDNTSTRKYYKKNMSSSGVEIRINGRVICYNLFQEVWNIEKHNSHNHLLVIIDVKSNNSDALPKTRTSKNGLREGDAKLEELYAWIRSMMSTPPKDMSMSDDERDLFEELKKRKELYNDAIQVIETEKYVFTNTGNKKDKVRLDLYEKTEHGITIYEGKKKATSSQDVYQLRMYWDGLVFDGVKPNKGILLASKHPSSVIDIIAVVNEMVAADGRKYNLECKTWKDVGIEYSEE